MLNNNQITKLREYIAKFTSAMIDKISPDNTIFSINLNNNVSPDAVLNHHLNEYFMDRLYS